MYERLCFGFQRILDRNTFIFPRTEHQTILENFSKQRITDFRLSKTKNVLVAAGGFGEVYKSVYGNKKVAIKRIRNLCNYSLNRIDLFAQEIFISSCLDHKNIIRMLGFIEQSNPYSYHNLIIFEWSSGTDLYNFIHKNTRYESIAGSELLKISCQIAEGLEYLHNVKSILHGDFKSNNIMIDFKRGNHIKIIDFGLSSFVNNSRILKDESCGEKRYWYSPEQFNPMPGNIKLFFENISFFYHSSLLSINRSVLHKTNRYMVIRSYFK